MADDNQKKQETQKFNKWMYIVLGIVLIISAFNNSEVNGVNEMVIYMGVAFIIFAFLGDLKKLGLFNPRSGSVVSKLMKKMYPGEEPPKKNQTNQVQKKKK